MKIPLASPCFGQQVAIDARAGLTLTTELERGWWRFRISGLEGTLTETGSNSQSLVKCSVHALHMPLGLSTAFLYANGFTSHLFGP